MSRLETCTGKGGEKTRRNRQIGMRDLAPKLLALLLPSQDPRCDDPIHFVPVSWDSTPRITAALTKLTASEICSCPRGSVNFHCYRCPRVSYAHTRVPTRWDHVTVEKLVKPSKFTPIMHYPWTNIRTSLEISRISLHNQ